MKKFTYAALLFVMVIFYAFCVNADLSDSMVRFHVIANSDSTEDQALKLKVRDSVISEASKITEGTLDKAEAVYVLQSGNERLREAALRTVRENGYDYDVTVEYGNFFFPEKEYGNLSLPSGRYDAMRVKIGKAKGKNWWCVMFPPICITEDSVEKLDEQALSYLKSELSEEEYEMITSGEKIPVVIRFRIVDAVMKLAERFRG